MGFRHWIAVTLLVKSLLLLGCNRGGFPVAVYPDMEYVFEEYDAWLLAWPAAKTNSSTIHIRLEDGRTFPLFELPEEIASGLMGDEEGSTSIRDATLLIYADRYSNFWYRNGRLVMVSLRTSSQSHREEGQVAFTIAPDADGPFEELPRTKEELVALFGEPESWDRYYPQATP